MTAARSTMAAGDAQPRAPDVILRRRRLEERLDESFGKRLTTIVAGAGYGKSTLLSAWASDVACAWHTVTSKDATLSTFHSAIAFTLAAHVRDFPAELATVSTDLTSGGDESGRGDTLGGLLAEALATRLTSDVMLVVDDAHLLPPEGTSAGLLESLCRQAPDTLHLVLVSRQEPPFPIARLRGQGQVLELVASDLMFSEREVEDLARGTLGEESAALAPKLHELTAGWPAAVRMALERLLPVPNHQRESALLDIRRPRGELFTYLMDEVFAREPADVRHVLAVAAEFQKFNAELGEALGLEDAATVLWSLNRRGLLVASSSGDGSWFTLHDLVRDFATQAWSTTEANRRDIHARAAAWFAARGRAREALRSLEIAADPEAIASFLRGHGRAALSAGAAEQVLGVARMLPAELDSETALTLGEAYIGVGNLTDARAQFQRAAKGEDRLAPHLAGAIALTYYAEGNARQALEYLARARIDGTQPAAESLALSRWSNAHGVLGEIEDARERAGEALELAVESGDDRARAHAHHALGLVAQLAGEHGSDTENYRHAIRHAERAEDVVLGMRSRANLAALLTGDGRTGEALELLGRALDDAELHGSADAPLPTLLTNQGEALNHLGRYEEAIMSFERVGRFYDVFGKVRLGGYIRGIADAHRERGDLTLARASYEHWIALAESIGNVVEAPATHSGLALTVAFEDPETAKHLAEQAVREDTGLDEVSVRVDLGWVALAVGDRAMAAEAADEAEQSARRRQYRAELARALELRALTDDEPDRRRGILEDAASLWTTLGNEFRTARVQLVLARMFDDKGAQSVARRAERRLRASGVRIEAAARAAGLLASLPPRHANPVSIQTLGGFLVLRRGSPVPLAEWQSRKARDLLKLLVTRRGRPVPRELLMEALWPGTEPAKVSNRLSVALSTLRSVLDPEHVLAPDRYVRADADAISLVNVDVDVTMFLEDAEAGLDGGDVARLEDAEALYAGEFLEEDLYQDWSTPLREEARAAYIRVTRALARASSDEGDFEVAARYIRRILERDAFDEHAHIALTGALQSAGQHGEARRAYQTYVSRMTEITVEPMSYPTVGRT